MIPHPGQGYQAPHWPWGGFCQQASTGSAIMSHWGNPCSGALCIRQRSEVEASEVQRLVAKTGNRSFFDQQILHDVTFVAH